MATPFKLKRSAVTGKRPGLDDMQIGELAINFYDGHLFAERDTGGVGIGTTVTLLTPWVENFGGGSINYNGIVTATTYHGNQVIGTPAGGFKSGAFTISNTDHTKDSIFIVVIRPLRRLIFSDTTPMNSSGKSMRAIS